MKIVLISPNRVLHDQWNKAIESSIEIENIYSHQQVEKIDISNNDIVIFDYDNCKDFLEELLHSKVVC